MIEELEIKIMELKIKSDNLCACHVDDVLTFDTY